jgi:hypothetical protein
VFCRRGGSDGRHVLELERHDVHAASKFPDAIDVLVRRLYFDVRNLSRWRVVFRREHVHPVAQTPGGHREHAAELATAENTDD